MDFEFSPEQLDFVAEVEAFLDAATTPTSSTSPARTWRRSSTRPSAARSWPSSGARAGWASPGPRSTAASEGEGVYEYLLNEALAGRGGPQIGKGVGIIGKTLIAHGSDFLKEKFLPMILRNEVEFAVGYSEPDAGSDAASMKLKAVRHTEDGKDRLAAQRPEDLDHLGALRRVVLARRPHRPRQQAPRHHADARAARPARRHHQRHLDDGGRAHQRGLHRRRLRPRRVRRRRGEQGLPVHLPGARPRALHHVHLLAHQAAPRPAVRVRADRPSATASR